MGEVWQMKGFFSIGAAHDTERRLLRRLAEWIVAEDGFAKNIRNPLIGLAEHGDTEVVRVDDYHAAPERDTDLMRDPVGVRRPELRIIVIRRQRIRAWPVDGIDVVPYHMVKNATNAEWLGNSRCERSKQHAPGTCLPYGELHSPRTTESDAMLRLVHEPHKNPSKQRRDDILDGKGAPLADRDDAFADEKMVARTDMRAGIRTADGNDLVLRSNDMRAHGIASVRMPLMGNNQLLSAIRLQCIIHKCPR